MWYSRKYLKSYVEIGGANFGPVQIGASPDTTTLESDFSASSLFISGTDSFITDGYEVIISGTIDINGTLNAASGTGGNTTVQLGGIWDATGGLFTSTLLTLFIIPVFYTIFDDIQSRFKRTSHKTQTTTS